MKTESEDQYSHSHQLYLKLDWSRIKLWLAQVVLTFLEEEIKKNDNLHVIYIKKKKISFWLSQASKTLKWYWPCSAVSASSGGVCVWGGAGTPLQAGSQAAEAAGAAWSLGGHNET